jgi:uncharacterized membrane protein
MLDRLLFALTLVSALGCGLIAGVFFAFSSFVMAALGRIPAAHGIGAMQSINIVVINPWFMTAFMGTAVSCALIAAYALFNFGAPAAPLLLSGGVCYVLGTFLATIAFNVPLNEALAAARPDSTEGAELWARYLRDWTAWNTLRTLAALVAAALLTVALYLQARVPAPPV